jgi:hypothetical protein
MFKLTYENGSPIWVDAKFVTHILLHANGMTAVQIVGYGAVFVKETPEQVAQMVDDDSPLAEAAEVAEGFWNRIFGKKKV